MIRCFALLLTGFVLLAALPDAAFGQRVPGPISGFLSVSTPHDSRGFDEEDPPPIQESRQVEGTASAVLSADYTRSRDSNLVSMSTNTIAMAEVFGGLRPLAIATARSGAETTDDGKVITDRARATASLAYEVSIAQREEPPIVFHPPLRLFADVRAEASFEGYPRSPRMAQATVIVSNATRPRDFQRRMEVFVRDGAESESARWGFSARPGDVIQVSLRAVAESVIRAANETRNEPAILDSEAIAIADPRFTFDQDGFDAAMADAGLETFRLADYYDIIYSPNLLENIFRDGFEPRAGAL
jgi:hypothetical protein